MLLPTNFVWPKAESERAQLLIPKGFEDPYGSTTKAGNRCQLDYDSERHLLLLKDDEETIYDIINPEDMIGALIKVGLNHLNGGSSASPRAVNDIDKMNRGDNNGTASNEPRCETPVDTQGSATLEIYVYPRKDYGEGGGVVNSLLSSCFAKSKSGKKGGMVLPPLEDDVSKEKTQQKKNLGSRYANHRTYQIAPSEDLADLSRVVQAIRQLARMPFKSSSSSSSTSSNQKENQTLLVILNPFAGRKQGQQIYDKTLKPMLEQSGFGHDVIVTQYSGHAQERMSIMKKDEEKKDEASSDSVKDISCYDGILAVGGDGVLHEIFQGLYARTDFRSLLQKIKIGHIGAGTSNGFSKSLTYACGENHAAIDYCFQVAKHQTRKMDLSKYQVANKEYVSFLTFTWAIIADIDIESECVRWLGGLRMDVWSAWRLLNLRTYKAKFSYKLPPAASKSKKDGDVNNNSVAIAVDMPPLSEALNKGGDDDGWVTEETDFVLFWASHVTHAADDCFHSPPTELPGEGVFTILVVR